MENYQVLSYEATDVKPMKKSTRYAAVFFVLLLVAYGIVRHVFYAWCAGLLFAAVVLLEKKMYVTEAGVETDYALIVGIHHDVWSFGEIEAIYREPMNEKGMVTLNFMKGLSGKRMVFSADDARNVVKLAQEKNKNIAYHAKS